MPRAKTVNDVSERLLRSALVKSCYLPDVFVLCATLASGLNLCAFASLREIFRCIRSLPGSSSYRPRLDPKNDDKFNLALIEAMHTQD
jgi:hypothetical protein